MAKKPATVLSDAMGATRRVFRWVAFFSLGINLLMLTIPLYMMQVFDRVLAGRSEATLFYLTVLALGALLTFGLLELVRFRIALHLNGWLERRLAPEAFTRAVTAALHGRAYRTEALRDLGQLRSLLGSTAVFALCDAPWVPVYVAVVYLLHPLVGTVVLLGAVLLFGLALANELVTRTPLRAANKAALAAMQRAESMARNAEVIDAMGMMPAVVARWRGANEQVLVQQTAANERAGLILALSKFGRLAVQIGVVGAGAWLAIHQDLTAGALIAGSIMTSRALAPVEQAIGTWKQVVGARAAYARLARLFVETPLPAAAMALPAPEGHLSVERASFVYPGRGQPIIKRISFHLPAGEALAIVGPSAAGKSTLARLLIGVWAPTAGSIRLDGADVHAWDRTDFGRHVGYLPQDVELFDGTVRDNIARFGEAPAEAIVEAARMADVHDMILHLPQGYETEVGEGGAVLSGGQRQRVALARALLGKPRLLVLDEPNSNLDGEGEEALSGAIAAIKAAGGTVVVIAHRPAVLAHVDKVLVLRDGQIDAYGARNEILRVLTRPRAVAGEGRQAGEAAMMPRQEARR